MTAGTIRKALKDLPDNAPVSVIWARGFEPGDFDPQVKVNGIRAGKDPYCPAEPPRVLISVSLIPLND